MKKIPLTFSVKIPHQNLGLMLQDFIPEQLKERGLDSVFQYEKGMYKIENQQIICPLSLKNGASNNQVIVTRDSAFTVLEEDLLKLLCKNLEKEPGFPSAANVNLYNKKATFLAPPDPDNAFGPEDDVVELSYRISKDDPSDYQ